MLTILLFFLYDFMNYKFWICKKKKKNNNNNNKKKKQMDVQMTFPRKAEIYDSEKIVHRKIFFKLALKRWFTAFPCIVRGRPHLHVNLQLFSSILSKKEKENENIKENIKGRSFLGWAAVILK